MTSSIRSPADGATLGALLLAGAVAVGCGGPSPELPEGSTQPDDFAFAVMADSRGGGASVNDDGSGGVHVQALTKALDHYHASGRGTLVIFTGDTVQGGTSADRLTLQLAGWNELVAPYRDKGLEFMVTSGNHEIDDGTKQEYAPSQIGTPTPGAAANQQAMLAAFPQLPAGGPADGGFTYHFRRNGVLFVVLDSYRPGHFHQLDSSWLESVLTGPAMQPRPSHVFVVTHAPAFPVGGHLLDSLSNCNLDRDLFHTLGKNIWPWEPRGTGGPRDVDVDWRDRRDALWKLLAEHGVTALLAAHEHNLSRQRVDAVWQIVSGGLANSLYEINDVPLLLYDGQAQNPRAGDTVWGAESYGYYLIALRGGVARAEAWGWSGPDGEVKLLDTVELR
jgi:hypothetical protein